MEPLDLLFYLREPADELRAFLEHAQNELPEVWALKLLSDDDNGSHKNNFFHSIQVVKQCGDAPDEVLLAALFHDVGKAPTRKRIGGKVTFHNHEIVGADLIRKRFRAIGLAEEITRNVIDIILLSSRMQASRNSSDSGIRRLSKDAGDLWDRAMILARADVTSRHQSTRDRVKRNLDAVEAHRARVLKADKEAAFRPVLNGHDLMDLGYEGRQLGEALKWLTELNRAGEFLDRDDALDLMNRKITAEIG